MTEPVVPADAAGGAPSAARLSAPPPVHRERRSRNVGWQSRDVLRTSALVFAMYAVSRLLWFAHPLVLTAFLGVLFGLAVTAGVDWLARFRIPRGVGAGLIVVGFIGLLAGFGIWAAPTLRTQSKELRTKLPEAADKLERWADAHRGGVLGLILPGDSSGSGGPARAPSPQPTSPSRPDSAAGTPVGATGGIAPTPPAVKEATGGDSAGVAARPSGGSLREQVFAQLTGARRFFFGFVTSTFAAVGGLLIVMFLTIYTAAEPKLYHDGLMHLFPHKARRRAGEVLTAMATTLRKWLLTQLIAMVVIGSVTTAVLALLGVRAALPLGILAGLFEFIPTVGPILSALPAILMGFVDSPEKAAYVAIAYVGIQFLENHLLIPLLMKGVDLPPALTILAQATMALVFGFLGLLVAVPMVAAAKVAVQMLYVEDVVGDPLEVYGDHDNDDDDGDSG